MEQIIVIFCHRRNRKSYSSSPKKLWATLRNLMGKEKTSDGISSLEENRSQICDSAQIPEIFYSHFSDLTKSLSDSNLRTFDSSTITAFVRDFKHFDCKLNFLHITPEQTQQFIESISSSKTTGADDDLSSLL